MFAENTHKSNDIIGISIFENKESDNILQYIGQAGHFNQLWQASTILLLCLSLSVIRVLVIDS
jgi:hypothetical protein